MAAWITPADWVVDSRTGPTTWKSLPEAILQTIDETVSEVSREGGKFPARFGLVRSGDVFEVTQSGSPGRWSCSATAASDRSGSPGCWARRWRRCGCTSSWHPRR